MKRSKIFFGKGMKARISMAAVFIFCQSISVLAAAQGSDIFMTEADLTQLKLFIGEDIAKGLENEKANEVANGEYVVRPGDTLSGIMERQLDGIQLNRQVLQDVIVHLNGNAFRRGNPHWLRAGAKLKIPTTDDIMNYIVPAADKGNHENSKEDWISFP